MLELVVTLLSRFSYCTDAKPKLEGIYARATAHRTSSRLSRGIIESENAPKPSVSANTSVVIVRYFSIRSAFSKDIFLSSRARDLLKPACEEDFGSYQNEISISQGRWILYSYCAIRPCLDRINNPSLCRLCCPTLH